MEYSIVIHYGEISLKGRNKKVFLDQLKKNIRLKVKGERSNFNVKQQHGYFTIDSSSEDVLNLLKEIPGIVWFAPARRLTTGDLQQTTKTVIEMVETEQTRHQLSFRVKRGNLRRMPDPTYAGDPSTPPRSAQDDEVTFAIKARRADKTLPFTSQEAEKKLGQAIVDKTGWQVDLDNPDLTIFINIYQKDTFIFTEKIYGLGGLPVGSTGGIIALLSGGIDSPVAAYQAARRGCNVEFLHFAVDLKKKDNKVVKLAASLSKYTLKSKLYIVPYTHFQLAILDKNIKYELILFRRFMARVAEQLAKETKAEAIVTGDNLSQVASQTLPNLVTTSRAVTLPILRPLLTYDKNEIVELAKKIDTYETSIEPYKDCCSIIDQHPMTRSTHEKLEKLEQEIFSDYEDLINQTLDEAILLNFMCGKLS
jgi:tRNA uracil 4-sulfurtransferase